MGVSYLILEIRASVKLDVEILLGVVLALQLEAIAHQLHDRLVAAVEVSRRITF